MSIEIFIEILLDSLKDSFLVFPFLLLTYIILEYIQRKSEMSTFGKFLSGKTAPLYASALGLFPQCGFSVMSAKLYEKDVIKGGTLLAVFIATSDEAFALLLTNGKVLSLLMLLLIKFCVALTVGFIVNLFIKKVIFVKYKGAISFKHEEYCRQCGSSSKAKNKVEAYLLYPLLHAVKTYLFVFVINVIFGVILFYIGEENIVNFMMTNRFLQPVLCAVVGLIPNCASSILITQIYIKGGISFGSMFAGLSANAGVGIAVMLKNKKKLKTSLILLLILYVVSVISGWIVNLF